MIPPKTTRTRKDKKMNSKNPYEIVAVKCEGCFTEWYSPNFKEPYEDKIGRAHV